MEYSWLFIIIVGVFVAGLVTAVVIPQVLDVAYKKKLFDNPDFRKIHKGVVPRLGGFAFLPAIICGLGISLALSDFDASIYAPFMTGFGTQLLTMLVCMVLLYLVGLKDDLVEVRYGNKFIVQGVCAFLTVLVGVYIADFHDFFGIHEINYGLGAIITFVVVIYIINSINLIDGIDGLASGIGIIALGFFGYFFFIENLFLHSLICWITASTISVFFLYNYFGSENGKKIFMGDTGALTLGMVIAFMTIEMTNVPMETGNNVFNPMILAFSPLILPLFDVIRVFASRILKRKSPFLPDKGHIHHLLMKTGLNTHKVLWVILTLDFILIVLNLFLSVVMNINIVVAIDVVLYAVITYCVSSMKTEKRMI